MRPGSDASGLDETAMESEADCAVIAVAHNSAPHIREMLESLVPAADGLRLRCLVVDNASSDETVERARGLEHVTVIEAGANLGYSGAINLGRAHVGRCSAIMIANCDLTFEPGSIRRLYEVLQQSNAGIAVPCLLDTDGVIYQSLRNEPSVSRAVGEAVFGARLPRRPGWLSETLRDPEVYMSDRDTDWAGGAVMLVSAECDAAVGEWDASRFFLYSEETDYAVRARRAGYRVRYVAGARVIHEEGGSGRHESLTALMAVNRVRYFEKYHRPPLTWVYRLAVALKHLLRPWRRADRAALRALGRRESWSQLPGGIA